MKLTGWFPGEVMPVRCGIYQRKFDSRSAPIRFSYWNGRFWGAWAARHSHASDNRDLPSGAQYQPWRGLARQPSTGAATKG